MNIVSIDYPIKKNRERLLHELYRIRSELQKYNGFFYYPYKDTIHNLTGEPNVSMKLLQHLNDRQNIVVDKYFRLRDQEEIILRRITEIDRSLKK